jgi:hypothetical protein
MHVNKNTGTKSQADLLPTRSPISHATTPPAIVELALIRNHTNPTIFHSNQAILASIFCTSENLSNSRKRSIKSILRFIRISRVAATERTDFVSFSPHCRAYCANRSEAFAPALLSVEFRRGEYAEKLATLVKSG